MTKKIFTYLKKQFLISEKEENELRIFFHSLEISFSGLKERMNEIGKKYYFENLENLRVSNEETNTLFFWTELFELDISVIALDNEDFDMEFSNILDSIHNPTWNLERQELNDICFDIFYSWAGYAFQKAKLYNNGIPMGIAVNSGSDEYYFNDFSYFSNYAHLYDIEKKVSRPFNRDLKLEEIFITTSILLRYRTKVKLVSIDTQEKEILLFKDNKLTLSTINLKSNESIKEQQITLPKEDLKGKKYLSEYFTSKINQGKKFVLNECEYE